MTVSCTTELESETTHFGSGASQYATTGYRELCNVSRLYALGVMFRAIHGEAPRWFSETDGEPRTFSKKTAFDHSGLNVVCYYVSTAADPLSCVFLAKPNCLVSVQAVGRRQNLW
jgi:hypothetical protein